MNTVERKPTVVRREEIALAILRIVGERGIASLSTATLAKEVGMSSGALFRHFASRDEMMLEAAWHAFQKLETTFPSGDLPPLERLMTLARNRVRIVGSDPGVAWVVGSEEARHHLPASSYEDLMKIVRRTRRFVLDALREGVEQEVIRRDIEPEALFVPVMGTIHALIGMRGAHAEANHSGNCSSERALEALALLLAPAGGPMSTTEGGRIEDPQENEC